MISPVKIDVGSVFGVFTNLIDDLFTSDEERAAAKLKLLELQQQGALAQLQVNQTEASHKSIFVSGWRPFIGWVCGSALAYNFLIYPFMQFVAWVVFQTTGAVFPMDTLPVLSVGELMPVLLGMLGLGAMRTFEKTKGVHSDSFVSAPTMPTMKPGPRFDWDTQDGGVG